MFCKKCGAELDGNEKFCGVCGTQLESDLVKCDGCGKHFNKEYSMCPFCGTEITAEVTEEEGNASFFVRCPKCHNHYDASVGVCVVCGYSEPVDTVAEEPSPEREVKCGYACPKGEAGRTPNAEVCPHCSYKADLKNHSVGQCAICNRDAVLLREIKVCDELGTRYIEACESCAKKYESRQVEKPNNEIDLFSVIKNTFSKHKRAIIGGIIAVIIIIILIAVISQANSGYICSECGERVREGYTVFGKFYCEDCFM